MEKIKSNPTSKETASEFADREIVIHRIVDAPRELVWETFTDPQHVVKWWGPIGFTTTIETMNVRPGGIWKLVMHGPDGSDYPNKSIFTEVVKPERLVYTHSGERKGGGPGANFVATWTFLAQEDGKTEVKLRFVFASATERDTIVREYGAIEGGQQTLARLSAQLAKTPIVMERTFDAPADLVWAAISDYDHMKQWYFPDLREFKPQVGFATEFNLHHEGKDYLHIFKVTEVIPQKKLSYSWKFGGNPGTSLLTLELFPEGKQTRLKLTHSGLETFDPETNPDLARGCFVKGWTEIVGTSLDAYLRKAVGG